MTRNPTNHHANDRTNHRSFLKFHGAELLKFCGKEQIPRLGSKFHGPWKTGPYLWQRDALLSYI